MGYHNRKITKGILGTISKVKEEIEEFEDAQEQKNKILQIVELSDIYGALEKLAEQYYLTMDDLKKMSDKTKSAFMDGDR